MKLPPGFLRPIAGFLKAGAAPGTDPQAQQLADGNFSSFGNDLALAGCKQSLTHSNGFRGRNHLDPGRHGIQGGLGLVHFTFQFLEFFEPGCGHFRLFGQLLAQPGELILKAANLAVLGQELLQACVLFEAACNRSGQVAAQAQNARAVRCPVVCLGGFVRPEPGLFKSRRKVSRLLLLRLQGGFEFLRFETQRGDLFVELL